MNAEFQNDFKSISDSKESIATSKIINNQVEFEFQNFIKENDNEVVNSNITNKPKCICLP